MNTYKYKFTRLSGFLFFFFFIVSEIQSQSSPNQDLKLHFDSLSHQEVVYLNTSSRHFKEILEYPAKEIEFFTNDSNSVIVGYSLLALVKKHSFESTDLVEKYIYDGRRIFVNEWGDNVYLSELLLRLISENIINWEKEDLSQKIKEIYIRLISYEPKPVFYKYIFLTIKPYEETYTKIKECLLERNIPEALVALSKYNNIEVYNILSEALNDENYKFHNLVIEGISYSKNPKFLPILKRRGVLYAGQKKLQGAKEFGIITALASYQSESAYKIIEEIFCSTKKRYKKEEYKKFIKDNLDKYPPPESIPLPKLIEDINKSRLIEGKNDF